ncbi:MAG: ATP-binding cassette domain-containing protein [Kofleriaceae bacterium]
MSDRVIDAVLTKRFGTREVLANAELRVVAGTVHALVGENGAGKSTLVKLVAGVLRADAGTLVVHGKPVELAGWDRIAARAAGIGIVQQHGASAGTLTVTENAVLGAEPTRGPWLELGPTAERLVALGRELGMTIDPHVPASQLSLGAAQRAEIVAAMHHGARLLILDEPTAVLAPVEVDGLLATLRTLAASGTTIVIVTHKLDEVRAVADDVTVLREGKTVATFHAARDQTPRLDVAAIANAMVGADLAERGSLAAPPADAPIALEVTRLVLPGPGEVSLAVRRGELLGVAGVDGNGQRELALAIAGLARPRGTIAIGGRDVSAASPRSRLQHGLAHIPEDRHHGGLLLDVSVADNLALGRRDVTGRWRIDRAAVRAHAVARIAELDVRPPDPDALARALSGGNQQKLVVGRELSRPDLHAVVAAQPTRGVDLGAVLKIHDRLRAAAGAGAGVLVISADLDELLGLCHRIVVMLRGRIVGELAGEALRGGEARSALGAMMTGARGAEAVA